MGGACEDEIELKLDPALLLQALLLLPLMFPTFTAETMPNTVLADILLSIIKNYLRC